MITLHPGVPLVEVVRSGVVESVHTGHLVALDPSGGVLAAFGDPQQPMFPRSSNKPLQAVGMRRLGLDVEPEQLALACASHSGEPMHLAVVQAMLARGGFTVEDLGCPPDRPLGEAAREEWIASRRQPARIAMNCSGKHAAMLLTAAARDWPIESYLDPMHPLQQALAGTVAELSGDQVRGLGVDGCGAPVLAISLYGVARAFSRLALAAGGPQRDVADAMRARPDLVGGSARPVTQLMSGIPGLIAKDGAEGVWAAALPDGSALAIKIDDGAMRAADRAVVAALRILGVEAGVLDELAELALLGGGVPVGVVRFRPAAR
ncbi:MAG: asparaginase [Actinomycetota bacterium]